MRNYKVLFACIALLAPLECYGQSLFNWPEFGGFAQPLVFAEPANQRYPLISAEFGVLGLAREQPDSQILAVDENWTPLLNADELQGDMRFGFQTYLDFYRICPWLGGVDWQLGYFGINSMVGETTIFADQVLPIFFGSIPADPQDYANVSYSSNLYSVEMNWRMRSGKRIRPVVGLRYFRLEDSFDTFQHGDGNVSQIGAFSLTNNTMFGGQFGLESDYWLTRYLKVYADAKYGAMHNEVEGTAEAKDVNDNEVAKLYGDRRYASFVDAGVGLQHNFAGGLSFSIGYRTIFASDVAMGIDQNASVNLLSPGETVIFNSQQWHGLDLMAIFAC